MPLFTSFAFPTSDAGTVPRTLPARLSETKNVRDFGAIGNGIANDLPAIMAAVNWPRITVQATTSNLRASFTGVVASASFTGAISGTTLTVSGVTGIIAIGQTFTTGTAVGTMITAGSGTTWTVSISQTRTSQPMTTNCILTASSVSGSPIAVDDTILDNGAANTFISNTRIMSQQSGTAGGAGVYILNWAQNYTSRPMITVSDTINFASFPEPNYNANVIDLDNPGFSTGYILGSAPDPGATWIPTINEWNGSTSIGLVWVGGVVSVGDRIQIDPTHRGTIYFPPGDYYVSAPIDFGVLGPFNCLPYIRFVGEMGASTVIGDFADYVFRRGHPSGARASGGHYVEKLTIINRHANGGGIRLGYAEGGYIRDCDITANICINDDNTDAWIDGGNINGSFETDIANCNCRPFNLRATGSAGCYKMSSGPVTNCTFIGFDLGIGTGSGQGAAAIHGCYFEGNNVGFACGLAVQGGVGPPPLFKPRNYQGGGGNLTLSGCYFKNNGVAMDRGGGDCTYIGISIEAATGSIPGDPQYGIRVLGNQFGGTKFQGVSVTGAYQQAGIWISGDEVGRHMGVMMGAGSVNSVSSPTKNWLMPISTTGIIKHCNVAAVYNTAQLPARIGAITTTTWTAGTATVNFTSLGDLSRYNTVSFVTVVSGVSLPGYNGTFTGTMDSSGVKLQYPLAADPGGSGSGGTVFFYPVGSMTEGQAYNVRDANIGTWGASVTGGGGSNHVKVKFIPNRWSVQGV